MTNDSKTPEEWAAYAAGRLAVMDCRLYEDENAALRECFTEAMAQAWREGCIYGFSESSEVAQSFPDVVSPYEEQNSNAD